MSSPFRGCEPAERSEAATERSEGEVVEGGGFEPPKASPADLQSAPFDHFGTPPRCQPRDSELSQPPLPFAGRTGPWSLDPESNRDLGITNPPFYR